MGQMALYMFEEAVVLFILVLLIEVRYFITMIRNPTANELRRKLGRGVSFWDVPGRKTNPTNVPWFISIRGRG